MKNKIDNELLKLVYTNREFTTSHLPYDREMEFYKSIQNGNLTKVKELFKPLDSNELGKLSDDPIRNLKYHLIITIALITRYCIEGGLAMEEAYTISDAYINQVDRCLNKKQIMDVHAELVEAYTQKMYNLLKKNPFSKPITKGIDYIFKNLHTKITLENIAEYCDCSTTYFSRLFHKEVGVTVKSYIFEKKIDEAKNLLIFTDYTVAEIASTLDFSSESHFIKIFNKYELMTPAKYRKMNYRKNKHQYMTKNEL